jgi:hypothetical protein
MSEQGDWEMLFCGWLYSRFHEKVVLLTINAETILMISF